MKSYLFHHHTREELNEMAKAGYIAIIPLAATEQHGPHLSVYTDSVICDYISNQATERAVSGGQAKLLLTPMLSIGCSNHHVAFGGTLSFSSETYLQMLKDIGESLIKCGFRKIIFLNAHGGNEYAMHQAASDLAVKNPIWVASASYWSIAREALAAVNASEVGRVPGHAGGFEASLMLALAADLVRQDKMEPTHPNERAWSSRPAGTFVGVHGELTGIDGYTDIATTANAEWGKKYLDAIVQAVADWFVGIDVTMNK